MLSQLLYYKILVESGTTKVKGADGKFVTLEKSRVNDGVFTFFDLEEKKQIDLRINLGEYAELEAQLRADIAEMADFGKRDTI